MKKMFKKSILILLLLILISSFSINNIFAQSGYIDKMGDLIEANYSDKTSASDKVSGLLTTLVVAVKIIAVAVAIIMLLVLGMKYMGSAPGERAEIKKHAVVYIVGAVVLFAVSGILTMIQKFSTALKN